MDLYTVGTTLFNYAAKGGMSVAGGGMLIISLAVTFGRLPQPPADRLLLVLGNYFIAGAVIGGLVGLVMLLRQYRKQ